MDRPRWKVALEKFVEEIKKKHGRDVYEVVLYGSRARSDADPLSDVDLLVVVRDIDLRAAVEQSADDIADAVSLDNDVVISVIVADINRYRESYEPLFLNIRREGIKVA